MGSSFRTVIRSPRIAMIVGAAAVVGLAFSLPTMLSAFQDADPDEHPVDPVPYVPVPETPVTTAAASVAFRREGGDGSVAARAPDGPVVDTTPLEATSPDGDIALAMKLRWSEYETGDRVLAKVTFTNHAMKAVYIPAPGEPDGGMAIVVEDENGSEVRRVVETARGEQLPRRMIAVAPGRRLDMPVVIVAEDETPLPPGIYSAYVEMRPDPLLRRLGLAIWTAPKGTVRSSAVALVVTAKTQ